MKRLNNSILILFISLMLLSGCSLIFEMLGIGDGEDYEPTDEEVEALLQDFYNALTAVAGDIVFGDESAQTPDGSYSMEYSSGITTYTNFQLGTSGVTVSGTTTANPVQTETSLDVTALVDLTFTGSPIKDMTGTTTIAAVLNAGGAVSAVITGLMEVNGFDFIIDDMNLSPYWIASYNAMVGAT